MGSLFRVAQCKLLHLLLSHVFVLIKLPIGGVNILVIELFESYFGMSWDGGRLGLESGVARGEQLLIRYFDVY